MDRCEEFEQISVENETVYAHTNIYAYEQRYTHIHKHTRTYIYDQIYSQMDLRAGFNHSHCLLANRCHGSQVQCRHINMCVLMRSGFGEIISRIEVDYSCVFIIIYVHMTLKL